MNGFTFKATAATVTLLATVFLPSLTFATSPAKDSNKTKIYRSQLGCMSCHQGESMPSDKVSKKNQDNVRQAQTVRAG
jgi:hypothetical protein